MSQIQYFNYFSSKTTRLIETKLHVEPLWNGGMKVFHMTKMANVPIYGKNPLKIFLRGLKGR